MQDVKIWKDLNDQTIMLGCSFPHRTLVLVNDKFSMAPKFTPDLSHMICSLGACYLEKAMRRRELR